VKFFQHGDYCWQRGMLIQKSRDQNMDKIKKHMCFHYHLSERPGVYSSLFLGRPQFQQFLVDAWATCEQIDLDWHRKNQSKLRAELYSGLQNAMVTSEQDSSALGQHVVLPSSFPGSHCY
jgi:hypothetical protein